MKVICISRDGSRRTSFWLNPWTHLVLPATVVAVVIGALSIGQFISVSDYDELLDSTEASQALTQAEITQVFAMLQQQQSTVQELEDKYETYSVDVQTLTQTLARLQAEATRLDAFGARLVKEAGLDPEEFDFFNDQPSVGGAGGLDSIDDVPIEEDSETIADKLLLEVSLLEKKLMSQRQQLESVAQLIKGRQLDKEIMPSGRPVKIGHISSYFGLRRDPVHGGRRLHKGIDFAAPRGTKIYAVAGGVVSAVERKGGYGNVVEIDHQDGLISRYAHLQKADVTVGTVVKKGQLIARVGNTGRSTGPHLHLEVLQDGQQIDPMRYLSKKQ